MITNTDNNVLPAGLNGATRQAVAPVGAVAGREVRGTGPSANKDTASMASVKQSASTAETRPAVMSEEQAAKNLEEVAEALNQSFGEKQSLQFSVDQDTGVNVIKVTQAGSGEIVRQIPNEEALLMMQRLNQSQGGGDDTAVLFDQMA